MDEKRDACAYCGSTVINGEMIDRRIFTGSRLVEQGFVDEDLRFADFSGCDLIETDFVKCNLFGATFKGAKMTEMGFVKCDLRQADFSDTTQIETDFVGCNQAAAS